MTISRACNTGKAAGLQSGPGLCASVPISTDRRVEGSNKPRGRRCGGAPLSPTLSCKNQPLHGGRRLLARIGPYFARPSKLGEEFIVALYFNSSVFALLPDFVKTQWPVEAALPAKILIPVVTQ